MKHGFLLIDKPADMTSHDAVAIVRRELGERKVGHLGTLDPTATGLLVLAVGAKALKTVEFFMDHDKEYDADVTFGAVSSTYDGEGVIEAQAAKPGWSPPDIRQLANVLEDHFIGDIEQVPPVHSAIHIDGHRAYELARQQKLVELPRRSVHIESCTILSYDYPQLKLHVACGSGTYIRSLAHDLGQHLRCGGYLSGLRRTRLGDWTVDVAVPPNMVTWSDVVPLKEALIGLSSIDVTDEEAKAISFGQTIARQVTPDTFAWHGDKPIAVLVPARDGSNGARPRKVL